MMHMVGQRYIVGLGATLFFALYLACGADAVGVDSCRRIEEARCNQAEVCNLPLSPPTTQNGRGYDACVRYYHDACLHGLPTATDPGRVPVDACVAAIQSDCAYVKTPEASPACSFLIVLPPDAAAPAPTVVDDSGLPVDAGTPVLVH